MTDESEVKTADEARQDLADLVCMQSDQEWAMACHMLRLAQEWMIGPGTAWRRQIAAHLEAVRAARGRYLAVVSADQPPE